MERFNTITAANQIHSSPDLQVFIGVVGSLLFCGVGIIKYLFNLFVIHHLAIAHVCSTKKTTTFTQTMWFWIKRYLTVLHPRSSFMKINQSSLCWQMTRIHDRVTGPQKNKKKSRVKKGSSPSNPILECLLDGCI